MKMKFQVRKLGFLFVLDLRDEVMLRPALTLLHLYILISMKDIENSNVSKV